MNHDIYHPVADIFPMMKGKPFEELCADIAVNGLREEIWRHEGKIIDGRNRYQACLNVGVAPRYREWEDNGDLVAFVLSLNLHRRHLSESQRAMVASKVENLAAGGDRRSDDFKRSNDLLKVDRNTAAKMLNVSPESVKRAKKARDHGVPELVEAVEHGDLTVAAAADLVELEPDIQKRAIAGGPAAVMQEVRKVRDAKVHPEKHPEIEIIPAKSGVRMAAIGTMIAELSELVGRPDHRYPFVQIKKKVAELSEAFSRIVGQTTKRTA